jgi:trigger factor
VPRGVGVRVPPPAHDQEQIEFDLKALEDYTFKFDLGLAPDFEVQGLDATFEKMEVEIEQEKIDEQLDLLRRQHGTNADIEDQIIDNDYVTLSVKETGTEDGLESEFSILVGDTLFEETLALLKKHKQGDTFQININEIEKDKDERFVKQYYLKVGEESADDISYHPVFDATVTAVKRLELAALDEEFFNKAFGEEAEVKTEEDARTKIKEQLSAQFSTAASSLLFRDMYEHFLEVNTLELPEAFLKRWMQSSSEKPVSMEQVEQEFEAFAKNLRWSLIRSKLTKQYEIEVSEEEIRENFTKKIASYFGGQYFPGMEEMLQDTVNRMMESNEQYDQAYQEVSTDKLITALEEAVEVKPKLVSLETFEAEIEKARAEAQNTPSVEEEEE